MRIAEALTVQVSLLHCFSANLLVLKVCLNPAVSTGNPGNGV